MKKKGFTLVELLVVIAIIALLMGILMPALARVRMIAYRMVCGTNLSGIGKAILLYAGDTKEAYPLSGYGPSARWSPLGRLGTTPWAWYDVGQPKETIFTPYDTTNNPGGHATIGSVFYLLVKYADTSVKQFNCKGDVGVRTFALSTYPLSKGTITADDFTKGFDFGLAPGRFCSYSYQQPFSPRVATDGVQFSLSSSSPPSMPLAADRNPTLDTSVNYLRPGTGSPTKGGSAVSPELTPCETWETPNNNQYVDKDLVYNSFAHQREGQNVLFADGSVQFSKTANVGVDGDNIWQRWDPADLTGGRTKPEKKGREACGFFLAGNLSGTTSPNPVLTGSPTQIYPTAYGDSLLVNECQNSGTQP